MKALFADPLRAEGTLHEFALLLVVSIAFFLVYGLFVGLHSFIGSTTRSFLEKSVVSLVQHEREQTSLCIDSFFAAVQAVLEDMSFIMARKGVYPIHETLMNESDHNSTISWTSTMSISLCLQCLCRCLLMHIYLHVHIRLV